MQMNGGFHFSVLSWYPAIYPQPVAEMRYFAEIMPGLIYQWEYSPFPDPVDAIRRNFHPGIYTRIFAAQFFHDQKKIASPAQPASIGCELISPLKYFLRSTAEA